MMADSTEQLFLALGRLEGKVDSLLNYHAKMEEQLRLHDDRIRNLEHHKHFVLGIAAVVGGIASVIVAFVSKIIGTHA